MQFFEVTEVRQIQPALPASPVEHQALVKMLEAGIDPNTPSPGVFDQRAARVECEKLVWQLSPSDRDKLLNC